MRSTNRVLLPAKRCSRKGAEPHRQKLECEHCGLRTRGNILPLEEVIITELRFQPKVFQDNLLWSVRDVILRSIRFRPQVPTVIQDQPIRAQQIASQTRVGPIRREGIHLDEIGGWSELRQQMVNEGCIAVRAPEIRWPNKKPLPRRRILANRSIKSRVKPASCFEAIGK